MKSKCITKLACAGLLCSLGLFLSANTSHATTFTGEYTGTFTGGIVGGPSPIILFSSGNGTDATAAYDLTNVGFSHNTLIPDFSGPPFAIQTIYNGTLTLSGGGNGLIGSYTGTFQLNDTATGGTINLDVIDLIGSGVLAGVTGSGTAFGTVVFNSPGPPTNFDGTFDVTVNATLTPLPAAHPLFASGLGAMGLLGWRRKRKDAALAA
jgi:hypothetical protein